MYGLFLSHCSDVIMGAMVSLITSLMIVYSTVYSGVDQRKHQHFASLAFVWGIHLGPLNSPNKRRKMFPFDDVTMRGKALQGHRYKRAIYIRHGVRWNIIWCEEQQVWHQIICWWSNVIWYTVELIGKYNADEVPWTTQSQIEGLTL